MFLRKTLTSVVISLCIAAGAWSQKAAPFGNTAFEEGRYAEAVTHYRQALSEEPTFEVYVNLGHACMRLGQWTDAAASYQAAIELDAASVTPDVWLFLGQAHYQTKQYEEALDAFLEVASSSPDRRASLWIARCLIEMEQWLRAKSALLAHLGTNPKDLEALELLAHVLGQMNDWSGVIDTYRELLASAPDRTAYRVAMANALAVSGQNQQAIETLELAWRLDRSATRQINRLLADLYLAEQMPHEAALCYARAIRETEQPSADDYFRLGMAYFQGREFVSAREALRNMQEVDPGDLRVDLYLGHIAVEEDRSEEAEQHFNEALEKNQSSTEVLLALAQLQMKEKQFEAAADHFARVLQSGDRRPQVHYNHILALLGTPEKEQQAKAALKAALAQYPTNVQIQQLLDRYVRQTSPGQEGVSQ